MAERDFVELKSAGTRGAEIRLTFPYPRDPDGYWILGVDLVADDLKCSHGVLTYWG